MDSKIAVLDGHVTTTEYEHVSIVYTCNTYFVMHWSMLFIRV